MTFKIDQNVSVGHLISAGVFIIGGAIAWGNLSSSQSQFLSELSVMKADAQARETRIRAVEIAQASQTSDLRTIQIGISEIKASLAKLGDKP